MHHLSYTFRLQVVLDFLTTYWWNFRDKGLTIPNLEEKLSSQKKRGNAYSRGLRGIRMRQEPCVYLRARLLVVPGACFAARPSCPGGNHFRPLSPLAAALSENMDRPWQYCRRYHPASPPPAWYTRPHFIYSIVSKFSDPFVRLNL